MNHHTSFMPNNHACTRKSSNSSIASGSNDSPITESCPPDLEHISAAELSSQSIHPVQHRIPKEDEDLSQGIVYMFHRRPAKLIFISLNSHGLEKYSHMPAT